MSISERGERRLSGHYLHSHPGFTPRSRVKQASFCVVAPLSLTPCFNWRDSEIRGRVFYCRGWEDCRAAGIRKFTARMTPRNSNPSYRGHSAVRLTYFHFAAHQIQSSR
jgi:hypothetical protein